MKYPAVLIISLFFMWTIPFVSEASSGNLLANPSFELAEDGFPVSWEYWQRPQRGNYAESTSQKALEGERSLRMTNPSDEASLGVLSEKMSVEPGKTYRASGYSHIMEGSFSLSIWFFDEDGNRIGSAVENFPAVHNRWNHAHVSAMAPENAAKARLFLYSGVANTGESYFDVMSFAIEEEAGRNFDFTDHGTAAPVAQATCITAMQDGDGSPIIFAWILGGAIIIDARTGEWEHYPTPLDTGGPFHYLLTEDDHFYFIVQIRGERESAILEFDVHNREWKIAGRGLPYRAAMSLTHDTCNDIVYGALYPDSHLVSYNRRTGEVKNYGVMNEETWPQYPGRINVDDSGWIYIAIGNRKGSIIAFNPGTGERRQLIEERAREQGRAYVHLSDDGRVYGQFVTGGDWHRFYGGEAEPIDEPRPRRQPYRWGWQFRTGGEVFRFPAGGNIEEISFMDKYAIIRDGETGEINRITFDYEGGGARVYTIVKGPDGNSIFGSTGHPLRMFKYEPAEDSMENWSIHDLTGHVNTLSVKADEIFGAIYGGGNFFSYNPSLPTEGAWGEEDANPRLLYDAGAEINRPHDSLACSDGKHVLMGGTPPYGRTGGGLLIYNMETEEGVLLDHEQVVPLQSTYALLELPGGKVLGGTTIAPGTGGEVMADEAMLYTLDVSAGKVVSKFAPVEGAVEIRDMVLGYDGLVYGIARMITEGMFTPDQIWFHTWRGIPVLFVYDPSTGQVLHREDLGIYTSSMGGVQSPGILAAPGNGRIYVLFPGRIVSISEGTFEHSVYAEPPTSISQGGPVIDGRIYFSSGDNLWSFKIID